MIFRLLIVLFFVSLSGCTYLDSLMGEDAEIFDPPAELTEFEASVEVTELWDRNTGKGTDNQYLMLQPAIADDKIYIADTNRKLIAMNASNGRIEWTFNLKLGGSFFNKSDKVFITGGPGLGENSVLIGTSKGDVISLDPDSGEEQWRSKVSSEILSAPQKNRNIVIVRTLDGRLFGLSGNNGRRIWTYDKSVPTLSLRGTSTPVIDQGVVINGFDGGGLIALDLNSGSLLWESNIATPRGRSDLERLVDIDSTPVISGPMVYSATYQGQLAALALDTGRTLWNRDISSHAGFSVDEDFLYITDDKSNIWAFDRYNGGSSWKQDVLLNRQVTAPTVIGNYLVVGDFEGYLHWLDKITGALVARQRISKDRIIVPPVISGNTVYAFSTNGQLAALSYQ
ncbi:MAG: outer membrane protein assembly factor BamB [Gammaproteobacteria bacterium]|jgi:outer membrane protein assembly factor BamB